MKKTKEIKLILVYLLAIIIITVYVFPILRTLVTSLKGAAEIMAPVPTFFPRKVTFDHYIYVWKNSNYPYFLKNSMIIASSVSFLTLLLAIGGAFSLSRLDFGGKRLFSASILTVYLFPGILLLVPVFIMMVKIGLYNNFLSVIIVHILFTLPFSVWTLRNFFDKIPPSLEDAARIDGASEMVVLFRIYLPLVTPGLATVAIFSFVVSWNEYMFALVLLSKVKLQVIPAGIAGWTSTYNIDWGLISAASILTVIPVFVFFCFLGRYFVKGLSAGSVKG